MTDIKSDIVVIQQSLRKRRLDQLARIEGYKLDLARIADQKRVALANIEAALKEVEVIDEELEGSVEVHGETFVDVDYFKKELNDG